MPSTHQTITSPTMEILSDVRMSKNNHNNDDSSQVQNPRDVLGNYAQKWQVQSDSEAFARKLDENDPLRSMRDEFFIPKMGTLPTVDKSRIEPGQDCIYLCGHSLGLQPKRIRKAMNEWLEDWADLGVHGHFHGRNPFAHCDYPCIPALKTLLGARDHEVGVMNQLTVNLQIMMMSFYRPTATRNKILYEDRAFPSDDYAIQSQIRYHGYDPADASILLKPRQNETYIRTDDVVTLLKEQGQSIALVLLSGVQFYTGQFFDIATITRVAKEQGCVVGWDIAHALGNVPLHLHDWNVDFAVWCSYKYLNCGAGCVGGIFVHSDQFDGEYPRLDGWWGNRDETRFQMRTAIDRATGADGFRLSNPSIHQCATLMASLEIFAEAGIENLRKKSKLLTQYLYDLIEKEINQSSLRFKIQVLTPTDAEERGAQLSLRIIGADASEIFDSLEKSGVCLDIRGDVLRVAPMPLYNSFMDVYRFVSLLKSI